MYLISTSSKTNAYLIEQAKELSQLLQMPYVPRKHQSVEELLDAHHCAGALVVTKEGPSFVTKEGIPHQFHLSMAHLRLLEIDRGHIDHLLRAIGYETATSVLDCTAGLGSDSAIISYGCPQLTRHTAIEGHPILGYITNYGFRHFQHKNPSVTESLRRIQLVICNYQDYLEQLEHNTYDVIYLDPMFENPVYESPQFLQWRGHLLESKITPEIVELALEKSKRLVIKERKGSRLFNELPPIEMVGGKYSSIAYGIYERR